MSQGSPKDNLLQRLTRENEERRAKSQKTFWQVFNYLGRLIGVWFLVGGGIVFLYALSQKDLPAIVFTALAPISGILLICAKPFRPHGRLGK